MKSLMLGMVSCLFISGSADAQDFLETKSLIKDYAETQKIMQDLVRQYPSQVRIVDLGLSDSGAMIQGVQIGKGSVANLVVATHHGNEYGSTEVAMAFAKSLAEAPIKDQTVYVVPVLNISGFNKRTREERNAGGRSYDPNRDYPGPCGGASQFALKSTAALARLMDDKRIVSSATLHTFSPAVVYPWGMTTHDLSTPYDGIFINLVKAATVESKYAVGNATQVIYGANGTFEDYAFWKDGVWSILFELGYSHSPNSNSVEKMIQVNVPGLRRMFEQAPSERAEEHAFHGKCDRSLDFLDRHDE